MTETYDSKKPSALFGGEGEKISSMSYRIMIFIFRIYEFIPFLGITPESKNVKLFDIKEGDTLILEEYDPEKKVHTGRILKKRVKNINKIFLTEFHDPEEIKKHGHWIIELE